MESQTVTTLPKQQTLGVCCGSASFPRLRQTLAAVFAVCTTQSYAHPVPRSRLTAEPNTVTSRQTVRLQTWATQQKHVKSTECERDSVQSAATGRSSCGALGALWTHPGRTETGAEGESNGSRTSEFTARKEIRRRRRRRANEPADTERRAEWRRAAAGSKFTVTPSTQTSRRYDGAGYTNVAPFLEIPQVLSRQTDRQTDRRRRSNPTEDFFIPTNQA